MRLGDLAILVAASAVGLAAMRWTVERQPHSWPSIVTVALMDLAPLAFSLSTAILAIAARRAGPPRRAICDRPGPAAALAILTTAGIFVVDLGKLMRTGGEFEGAEVQYWWPWAVQEQIPVAGGAVIAVWGVLVASGRWCPEPTLIDRLGRALGGYWIVTTLMYRIFWG